MVAAGLAVLALLALRRWRARRAAAALLASGAPRWWDDGDGDAAARGGAGPAHHWWQVDELYAGPEREAFAALKRAGAADNLEMRRALIARAIALLPHLDKARARGARPRGFPLVAAVSLSARRRVAPF